MKHEFCDICGMPLKNKVVWHKEDYRKEEHVRYEGQSVYYSQPLPLSPQQTQGANEEICDTCKIEREKLLDEFVARRRKEIINLQLGKV